MVHKVVTNFNMATAKVSLNVSDFDSVLDLVHQQASKFFTGM